MSEAKRHHYIPQFILKNFLDNKGQVFYWDIEKEVLEKRNPRSIFMNFELIKRQYKNIADIMTYDDLIQRLKNIITSFKMKL